MPKDFTFTYVGDKQGDEGIVRSFPEGTTQSFVAEDLVTLSSGTVVNAIAVGSNLGNVTNTVLGFAKKAATGVAGTMIPVLMIRQTDIFRAAMDSDDTHVATDVNITGFEVKRLAAGQWVVDQDATTNAAVVVLGSAQRDSLGSLAATAGGSVYVKFRASRLFLGV